MTKIIEQMKFCNQLEEKLTKAVLLHENRRNTLNKANHTFDLYGSGLKEAGASKTQIMASIVQLRRELNIISRMFDDCGKNDGQSY